MEGAGGDRGGSITPIPPEREPEAPEPTPETQETLPPPETQEPDPVPETQQPNPTPETQVTTPISETQATTPVPEPREDAPTMETQEMDLQNSGTPPILIQAVIVSAGLSLSILTGVAAARGGIFRKKKGRFLKKK